MFYPAFDLAEAGLERIQEMFGEMLELLAAEVLQPLPVTALDIRHTPEAFRYMSQARHSARSSCRCRRRWILVVPVLVTGGAGAFGGSWRGNSWWTSCASFAAGSSSVGRG